MRGGRTCGAYAPQVRPSGGQRSLLRAEGLLTHAVILTKVRTQDHERRATWLWVLTFVRMTGRRWLRHARPSLVIPAEAGTQTGWPRTMITGPRGYGSPPARG